MISSMKHVSGVSLIEILVAVLVLAVGVLGSASLQVASLRGGVQSHFSTGAQNVVDDLINRMIANRAAAENGDYSATAPGSEPSPNCMSAACTSAEMASHDLWQINDRLMNTIKLPQVDLSMTFDATNIEYGIALTWDAESDGASYSKPTCTATNNANLGCIYTAVRL